MINTGLVNLRLLSARLGKAPTLIYLMGYLILIFVFSLFYFYALPGKHFYQSTSQYEYEFLDNDSNKILHDLQAEIISAYRQNGEAEKEVNGWQIDTDNLVTDSLYTGNFPSEFSFQIVIPISNADRGGDESPTFLLAKATVFTDGKFISNDVVYSLFNIENTSTTPVQGIPSQIPSPGIIFDYKMFDQQTDAPVLPLSLNLYNRIIGFGQGNMGFPSGGSGQYLRMLYFSTGIATSTALGDILPVSTQARLSVISETIIAVIFIGLFLNSLAFDIGEALRDTKDIAKKTTRNVSITHKKRPTKPMTNVKSQRRAKTKSR